MTTLYLWDDATAELFAPFSLTRPVSELRAGALLIRERWERAFQLPVTAFVAAERLDHFDELGAPRAATLVPAGAIVANSRFAPSLALGAPVTPGTPGQGDGQDPPRAWRAGDRVAAVRLSRDVTAAELRAAGSLEALLAGGAGVGRPDGADRGEAERELDGRWLDAPWELIATLEAQLTDDILALAPSMDAVPTAGMTILGDHPVLVARGATIEPFVCIDATAGPVLVRPGATISSFTRLVGPSVIGEGSTVLGGRVACVAIGERCKVSGDVSHVVLLAYANKGHEGFVGHSYLGRWVNLGAGTTTSNLKNTYGPVSLWTPRGYRDTGMQFLGTLFGDHVKTGIGTCLSTGTVLGAGANVFGGGMPARAVAPFAWGSGEPYATYELGRFVAVAERVMARRGVALGERGRLHLRAVHDGRSTVDRS